MNYLYDFYLAGPMSGLPEHNYPTFIRVAQKIKQRGFTVFNPAEHNFIGVPAYICLQADIDAIVNRCERIAFLPGWRKSEGANTEALVAQVCGKSAYEIEETEHDLILTSIKLAYEHLPYLREVGF